MYKKKKTKESQDRRNFESVRALFVICTRFTTLNPCYTRMYSFSANQKGIMYIIKIEASGAKTVSREAQSVSSKINMKTLQYLILPFYLFHLTKHQK